MAITQKTRDQELAVANLKLAKAYKQGEKIEWLEMKIKKQMRLNENH